MKEKTILREVSWTVSSRRRHRVAWLKLYENLGQDAYQGGLICQSIVGFHGRARKLLIDDITSLTSDELSQIFDTPPGSFLFEKMAKNIPDKKFIEIIKHFPIDKIAFGRFGSRAVEGIEFHLTLNFCNFIDTDKVFIFRLPSWYLKCKFENRIMEKWLDQIESSTVWNVEGRSCWAWSITIRKTCESQTKSYWIRER